MLVQEVMTREPTTVIGETTIKRAAEILTQHEISSLPVLDDSGRICGVVSEADLIRGAFVPDARGHMLPGEFGGRAKPTTVAEVMTPHALTAHESSDIADVADQMTSTGVKSLPVMDDSGRLVGIVSRSDLVKVRAGADDLIESEVDARLAAMGHGNWFVEVTEGDVEIDGPATAVDRSMAQVIASTIPGVVKVRVRHP
jgi:CBS domain-containing protein